MREIGEIADEKHARIFCDALYSEGIESDCELNSSGKYTVWVHRDEHLADAEEMLERFLADPDRDDYRRAARAGRQRFEEEKQKTALARDKVVDVRTTWASGGVAGFGKATSALMAIAIGTTVLQYGGQIVENLPDIMPWLFISNYKPIGEGILKEVREGQVWRLFTPMFLHFGIMHILFNMMWLRHLGSMIENADGIGKLLTQVLVIAAVSNVAQYFVGGPHFGGMSGVNYGLFGYVWIYGTHEPRSGLFIDRTNTIMMLVWAVLCLTGLLGPVANTAHFVGLGCGVLWASVRLRRIPFTGIQF